MTAKRCLSLPGRLVAVRLGLLMLLGLGRVSAQARPVSSADGAAAILAFDHVTVVDVERGRLRPDQRAVVANHRIQAVGPRGTIPLPLGSQVVDAQGKYLIPGLWDLHVHLGPYTDVFYPLLLVNGVTGIRDAASEVPLATQRKWRADVVAGRRVGPPRQVLSGPAIDESENCGTGPLPIQPHHEPPPVDTAKYRAWLFMALQSNHNYLPHYHHCIAPTATAMRHLVDSLKAAGVDMLKTYTLSHEGYLRLAAEAHRAGLPFGGHYEQVSATEAADSGASILDHELPPVCRPADSVANVTACRALAELFQHTGTWVVPTMVNKWVNDWQYPKVRVIHTPHPELYAHYRAQISEHIRGFWADPLFGPSYFLPRASSDSLDSATMMRLCLAQVAGLPIASGTDDLSLGAPFLAPGFSLQLELTMYVAEGLTPLTALQSATLNPAKMLHATDSLGTVARGKLADLVLLDANPLEDITNTAAIRAVVANGRHFDRAALDRVLAETRVLAARLYPLWLPRP